MRLVEPFRGASRERLRAAEEAIAKRDLSGDQGDQRRQTNRSCASKRRDLFKRRDPAKPSPWHERGSQERIKKIQSIKVSDELEGLIPRADLQAQPDCVSDHLRCALVSGDL